MTESKKPEQVGSMGSQPGPGKEHFEKFKIGSTEEDIKKFRGPEWRSEVPDIRMQAEEGTEGIEELDLLRLLGYERAAATSLGKFKDALKKFEQAKTDDEKEPQRETLRRQYEVVMTQSLDSISSMFDATVDQKKNAYPYEYRGPQITIGNIRESFASFGNEEWQKSEEGKVWLKRAEQDLEWLDAFFWVSTAQTVSEPYYFDVVQQLQVLKEGKFRAYVTEEILEKTFAEEIPGMEFTPDEEKFVQEKGIGFKTEPKYREGEKPLIEKEEAPGLRELAVGMLSDSFETRMRLAAASQADYSQQNPEKTTFLGGNFTKEELDFYESLLEVGKKKGEKEKGRYILSPYASSKAKDKRETTVVLEAILVTNANQKLKEIIAGPENERAEKISSLVEDVKKEFQARKDNWFGRDREDLVSKLAVLVTRQGFLQDHSFMHAYRYCWGYIWKTDEEGEFIRDKEGRRVKKSVAFGGIYTPSGDIPTLYWAQRAHKYDLMSNSRTQFLPPTDKSFRLELKTYPPDKMPEYDPKKHPDWFLKKQWDFLFSDEPEFRQLRKKKGYPDIPKPIADTLKSWAWRWRVPYKSDLLGEEGEAYNLEIIMFMPPGLNIANFFETVKVGENGETIWKKVIEGTPLSKISWQDTDVQQVDRWLVDCDMGSRFMRTMIEVFDPEKDPFHGLVAFAPSTLGPKEAAKRLRLCFRDDPDAKPSEYELALIPFYVTQACANKWGITSPEAWETTSEEVKKTSYKKVDRFLEEMTYWKRALSWLPGERGVEREDERDLWIGGDEPHPDPDIDKYTHYGKVVTMLAEYYQNVILRIAKASAEDAYLLANKFYEQTKEDYKGKDYEFLRKGDVPGYSPRTRDLKE